MKLLLVEDDVRTAQAVRRGLVEAGFVVDVAHDGRDGLACALGESYEALILDVMLPGCDGWTFVRTLRQEGSRTPVLYLSALDSVEDRVKGLTLGADDYLVKPFAFSELLARVHCLLRRSNTLSAEVLRIADLELDLTRHVALRQGQPLNLTAKEFTLLALFVRHPGHVLSRWLIAEQVWDMNFDPGSNVIDVHVRRLRSKVDDPFDTRLLHTVRGAGYVLRPPA